MNELSLTRFKTCTKCGITYPATRAYFHTHSTAKYNLSPSCKVCTTLYRRSHYLRNRSAVLEQCREYRETNKERVLQASRARYQAKRSWYLAYRSQWSKDNRERRTEAKHRRRALENGATGSHSFAELWAQLEAQHHACYYCLAPLFGEYHADHMTPLSRGGSDYIENIVIACPFCNVSKGSRTEEEFQRYREAR